MSDMNTTLNSLNTTTKLNAVKAAAALLLTAGLGLTGLAAHRLHADPTNGQSSRDTTVVHGTDDVYQVKYNGGQEGDVHVRADDDGDDASLEVKVYDPHGSLVTRDFGSVGHSPVASWNVSGDYEWRQYTIKVVNLSYHSIPYDIHFF
jgi:hypothetical protein